MARYVQLVLAAAEESVVVVVVVVVGGEDVVVAAADAVAAAAAVGEAQLERYEWRVGPCDQTQDDLASCSDSQLQDGRVSFRV